MILTTYLLRQVSDKTIRLGLAMVVIFGGLTPLVNDILRPATVEAASSPVSHWTMDEASGNRADSIGGRNLSPTGSVTASTGQVDGAVTVAGTGQYLSAADHASLSTGGETSFSISLWVKLSQKSGTQVFVSKYAGSSGEYAVYYEHTFRRFVFSTYSSGQNQYAQANTLGEPALNTWYHITAVHDAAANTNAIIVNGGTPTTTSSVSEPADTSAPFLVGAFGPSFQFPAYAAIDDVKFFRSTLNQQDAQALFEGDESDFAAYWKLDEGSGTTALDSSSNGHTGTLTNVTYSASVPPSVEFDDPYSAYFNSAASGRVISTPLSLNNYTEFTMSGWIHPTASGNRMSLFGQNDIFEFGFADSDTIICYTPKGEVSWNFVPGNFLGNWHHITCLATPTELIMYINGQNVASTGISSGSFGSSGNTFSIGAGTMDGGTAGPFTGYIDDVRVYTRGLTPNEMDALGTGSIGPTNGPSVSITSPANGGSFNTWSPSVNWDNADTCEYKLNSGSWQLADCADAGSDIPSPAEGADQTLSIRASYNNIDNPGSANSSFDFDTSAPTVNAGNNRQTNASFVLNTATASDPISGLATVAWQKQSGPGTVSFSDAAALQPTVTSISHDGTYVLRLTATDRAGNSTYDDVTIIWDTTDPDIALTAFPNQMTNSTSASFGFSATDSLSEPLAYSCKIDGESFNSCTSPKQYSNLAEGQHNVRVRALDSAGNTAETSAYTWTVDTTPPVITLNGLASLTVVEGTTYTEAGATAVDTVSGDLTAHIELSGHIASGTPGTYTITYTVADHAGNAATAVTRSVRVISADDLNNDGTPDEIQPSVSRLVDDATNTVTALDVSEDCSLTSGAIIHESDLSSSDAAYDYTHGLFDFSADCSTATTTIHLYYYGVEKSNLVLRKYNPQTGAYFNLTSAHNATVEQTVINGITVTVASYTIIDGGDLDMDGAVNGAIVDPAGLATQKVGSPNTGLRPALKLSTPLEIDTHLRLSNRATMRY